MAMINQFFNPQATPVGSRDVIPAVWYVAMYVSGDLTEINRNGNQWIAFNLQVVEGEHAGASIEDRIQVAGSNAGIEYGQRKLAGIARGLGFVPTQTEDMMGKTIAIRLDLKTDNGTDSTGNPYPPKNEVKEYQPVADFRARMQRISASAQHAAPVAASPAPTQAHTLFPAPPLPATPPGWPVKLPPSS